MSPRSQRALYRLLALFLAAGAGDAIIQFVTSTTYDWRHLAGALVAAAVMALEQYLKNSPTELASPTVEGVNVALQNQSQSVPPPSVSIPKASMTVSDPNVPGPGV